VLLRPFCDHADDDMPPEDLWVYRHVGEKGAELTGYPAISVYHEFRYHPKQVITGAFDWIYDHLGIFTWTVELWSPMREAGIEKYDYIGWFRDHPIADDLKLIRWSDEKLGGEAFVDWRPFDHPQLGAIELGGWNKFRAIANPPPSRIESEIARFPKWLVYQALMSPRLELLAANATRAGEGTYRVQMVVHNTGYLPSYVSKLALEHKVVRGVSAEITLPEGATLVTGKTREQCAQLEGRAYKHTGVSFWPDYTPTDDRLKIEWVVRANAGSRVQLTAWHERAGRVSVEVGLE
jgi:murein tripeptide amidase MpaA